MGTAKINTTKEDSNSSYKKKILKYLEGEETIKVNQISKLDAVLEKNRDIETEAMYLRRELYQLQRIIQVLEFI